MSQTLQLPPAAPAAADARPSVGRGATLFLVSATLVHAGNYAFNVIAGRWLGPEAFAELGLIVNLMLIATVATTTLELVAARTVARADVDAAAELAGLTVWARRVGMVVGAALVLGAPVLRSFFASPSVWPYVILGTGLPVYLVQGVHRGALQGARRFSRLAASFQVEMVVRVVGGAMLLALGFGVLGATVAISTSFVGAWLVARPSDRPRLAARTLGVRELGALVGPSLVLLVGQVLINHSDLLVVKHASTGVASGHYVAVSLLGRAIFFGSWSLVTLAFPLAAATDAAGARRVLVRSAGAIAALGGLATLAAMLVPDLALRTLFGAAYVAAAPLLGPYALATTLFAVAVAVASHDLARGHRRGGQLVLIGGCVQLAAVWLSRGSLAAVVDAQVAVMAALLMAVLLTRKAHA